MTRRLPALAMLFPMAFFPLSDAVAQQRTGTPQAARTTPGKPAEPTTKAPEPAPAPESPAPPYEKALLRLSEILGSLAFLRTLCSAPDATEWQKRMQALLEAEGTTPGRRDRLAGAYNRGYRGYALTYRTCTASAAEATLRYLKEGEQLSRDLAGRYGG
jgi:uncharacterized protein (TIGR02301 family)